MKHFIFVTLLVVILAAVVIFGLTNAHLLPVAASTQAIPIDNLFHIHFILIGLLFSLIVGFMLYSILVFRRRKGDTTDGPHIEGNTALEVIWTAIPLIMVIALALLGSKALADTLEPAAKPLRVKVTARQWDWFFEYPDYQVGSAELYLPVDKQVLLQLTSEDVIHSFWVPEFRVKQDLLPGGQEMMRELRITPDRLGDYKVRCAELCGQLHYKMEKWVHVVSQADFDTWIKSQTGATSDDPVVRGQYFAQQNACLGCHSTDGSTLVGPSWKGLSMSNVPLQDGTTVVADDTYLHNSIVDPNSQIVQGFDAGKMPTTYREALTDEQIADIIEFIKSLK